mgnify:CR=1 FL=1
MKEIEVTLTVNKRAQTVNVVPRMTLVDCLRDILRLTGTHVGCEHGVCGACSVMFDGEPVRSCLMFAVQAEGHEITTVEGLVGEDGPTHAGVYDYAYLRTLPEIIIAAPSSEAECRLLLSTCYQHQGPAAVRYPRGQGPGELPDESLNTVEVGRSITRRKGQSGIVILGFGSRVFAALKAAEKLDATVVDMRWVKPLDETILRQYADAKMVVTVEEHQRMGGAGSAVGEYFADQGLAVNLLSLGLPDRYEVHAKPEAMLARVGLDASGIEAAIEKRLS